jgi:hypothetical protein
MHSTVSVFIAVSIWPLGTTTGFSQFRLAVMEPIVKIALGACATR